MLFPLRFPHAYHNNKHIATITATAKSAATISPSTSIVAIATNWGDGDGVIVIDGG